MVDLQEFKKKNFFVIYTCIGVLLGVVVGLINNYEWVPSSFQRYYWAFPATLNYNMLKVFGLPIIVFSITTAMASLGEKSTRMAGVAFAYTVVTTVLAVVNGIIFGAIVKPGARGEVAATINASPDYSKTKSVADGLLDIIRNIFPNNILEATIDQTISSRSYGSCVRDSNGDWYTDYTHTVACPTSSMSVSTATGGGTNTLGLIMFCAVLGYMLGKLSRAGNSSAKQVLDLMNGLNGAVQKMVDLVMWYVPVGLFFTISNKIMGVGIAAGPVWNELGYFILASLLSLFIHGLVILPLIYWFVTKKNPICYMTGMLQALVTAFASASSATTMPITIRNVENKNNVDPRVARFMLPLGTTINMDGTALFQGIACLFIANISGDPINFGQHLIIIITATLASIGAAAVPSGGLVTLLIVLGSVGRLHFSYNIALIVATDWFLDRIRTATNVWGNAVGCAVVEKYCAEDLEKADNYVEKIPSCCDE